MSKFNTPVFWQNKNVKSFALWPFGYLYRGLMAVDRFLKMRQVYRPNVPVISVGNIAVGGSGKTPIVSMLAEHYSQKGHTVAVLCRGYGADVHGSKQVDASAKAETVGDEPYMLFKQKVAAQVWVGVDRCLSAKNAEASGATLIILDDGFQHWRLARDVDIVTIGSGALGNGYVLPAGPLREPEHALSRADMVISMKELGYQTSLSHNVRVERGLKSADVAPLLGRDVLAFCGIGYPQQFFKQLIDAEVKLVARKTYPDHHPYNEKDLKELVQRAGELSAQLVTTEKDFVKLTDAFAKRVRVVRPSFDEKSQAQIITMVDKLLARATRNLKNMQKKAK